MAGGTNPAAVQEEIKTNMSVVSHQTDLQNEEELLYQAKQNWINSRTSRKKNAVPKHEQQKNTLEWVKRSSSENILDLQANEEKCSGSPAQWTDNSSQDLLKSVQSNNKSTSENIDTLRENIRNSQESLKQNRNSGEISKENLKNSQESLKVNRNSAEIAKDTSRNSRSSDLTASENLKSSKNIPSNVTISIQDRQNIAKTELFRRPSVGSQDSLNSSTASLADSMRNSFRGSIGKDAHSYAIDLSNSCREFYFNHQKKAEAIKQSIRASKHKKAIEKLEGKKQSSIDNAMERLRSEMADLMDQNLSLMSQLLKLNDKIEEVKTRVSRQASVDSNSSCYLTGEESEISDCEDSRLDLSTGSYTKQKQKPIPPPKPINYKLSTSHQSAECRDDKGDKAVDEEREVLPRKIAPTERDIIVYRKKVKKHRRSRSRTGSTTTDSETENGSTCSEMSEDSASSDTESTISYKSGSGNNVSDTNESEAGKMKPETNDSGIQSPTSTKPAVPPKPVKGGISMNSNFLRFHEKNGSIRAKSGLGSVLTLQGHNIPIDKYYVPQGLVYLKHTQSENVFCQFSH